MTTQNVHSKNAVSLVGGGNPSHSDIVISMAKAPKLVAADGGANFCLQAGLIPEAVIGDLDSISNESRAHIPKRALIEYFDQDITDFEKCLRRIKAPFIIASGFTDGRMDHTLANFAVLARRVGSPTLLLDRVDVAFAAPQELSMDLPVGTRFSLFPFAPVRGQSTGLKWPIDGLTIDPAGRLGTSNEVEGPLHLTFDAPGTIVIIPKEHLAAAIAALTD